MQAEQDRRLIGEISVERPNADTRTLGDSRGGESLRALGLADLVEFREGDALPTLAIDLPERIDLLLLDGAKALYGDILALVESRLRPGAVIVADNADHCPDHLDHVGSVANGYISMPFTDDVELSIRLG